jgi:hypothetical protein
VKPGYTPIRWPAAWTDTSLLRDTAIEVAPNPPPPDVVIVKGEWPGIRSAQEAGAGPTGVAWVDSNGWIARLAAARNPGKTVWIDAAPTNRRYLLAMADAAAFGARWLVAIDDPAALKPLAAAARFFADHREWETWTPQALIGVVSDFQTDFSQELLNLLDRAGMHNRVLLKDRLPADPSRGLRTVLYPDRDRKPSDDPYVVANDAVIRVSHRYDLVRCWNTGAMSSNYLVSLDRSKAVVHLIFYADRGPDSASVRIVGRWRTAQISSIEQPSPQPVKLISQKDAVEVHLPQVSNYVALQLFA